MGSLFWCSKAQSSVPTLSSPFAYLKETHRTQERREQWQDGDYWVMGDQAQKYCKLTTEIWDNERCSSNYEKKYPDSPASIPETMLCSGKEGKSPCHGDSGGPFMFRNDDGHWEQIGVVSWGGNLCGQNNLPAVFTRITHFMDWIKKVQRLYPN